MIIYYSGEGEYSAAEYEFKNKANVMLTFASFGPKHVIPTRMANILRARKTKSKAKARWTW